MLGHRQLSAAEFLRIGRRRWKVALVSLLLGSACGYALARILPARYVSIATVAQWAGGGFGPGPAADALTVAQLTALSQQVFTQEQLKTLAGKYGGLGSSEGPESSGGEITRIANSVALSPAGAGFTVSFTARDPRTAQQACTELASLFLQEALKSFKPAGGHQSGSVSLSAANPVADYLAGQVADAKRNLDEREAKLADFRRQHAAEINASSRGTLESKVADDEAQLRAADAALKSALQQRTELTESLLAQQAASLRSRKPAEPPGTEALEEQLAAEQAKLVTLETRYTPDHPDVVKLRGDIEQLQKKIDAAKKARAAGAEKNPEAASSGQPGSTTQLQAQIHELDVLIQEKTREQARFQQEILAGRARLDKGSILDEEQRELSSEAANARSLYTGLLARQSETQKSASSDPHPQEDQWRLAIPANLPERPAFPDRVFFTLGGAAAGIAFGLFAMVAGEMRDKSMHTAGDVEFFLELPTLAVIPPATAGSGHHGTRGGHLGNRGEKEEGVLTDV